MGLLVGHPMAASSIHPQAPVGLRSCPWWLSPVWMGHCRSEAAALRVPCPGELSLEAWFSGDHGERGGLSCLLGAGSLVQESCLPQTFCQHLLR